ESIHPFAVTLQTMQVFRRKVLFLPDRQPLKAEYALLSVCLDGLGAEDFRKLTIAQSSQQVHLPETILRGHVALSKNGIIEGLSKKMRHPHRIAHDLNRVLKAA